MASQHGQSTWLVNMASQQDWSTWNCVAVQGWQLLIHSSMECLAAIQKGQQRPADTSTASTSGLAGTAASLSKMSVQLHATELVAELVANTQCPGEDAEEEADEHPGGHLSSGSPVHFQHTYGLPCTCVDWLEVCVCAWQVCS